MNDLSAQRGCAHLSRHATDNLTPSLCLTSSASQRALLKGALTLALALYFCLSVGLWAELSATPKSSLNLTNSLTAELRDDNQNLNTTDDNYGITFNRLSFNGQSYGVQFDGRLDSMYVLDPPLESYRSEWVRVERLHATYRHNRLTLELGDLYQQLGRGQLLALRKVDELGLDIALRGGRVSYSGDTHALKLFGGVANVVNLDSVSQRFVEDRDDLIVGAHYELRSGVGNLGLMYVYAQPEEQLYPNLELPDASSSGGVYYEAPALTDWLSAYVELDVQQRRAIEALEEGYAGYATLDVHHLDTSVLIEGVWLEDFEQRGSQNSALRSRFNYNQAPTLERIDQEVAELYNVRGARVRAQEDFWEGDLSVHANLLHRVNRPNDPMELKQYHAYSGFELYYEEGASRLSLSGGHRFDEQRGRTVRTWSHAEGDWVQQLKGPYAAHLTTQLQRIRVEESEAFVRGSTIIGAERAGLGGLSFEWGVDTQNPNARQLFYAGILEWELSSQLKLNSVVGSQRGGIKCVAGVCRDFPSFSGVRLQLVGRY